MIDTHLHLWQLSRGWYDWITPALGPLYADSLLGDVAVQMSSAGVTGAVVIQAADTTAETEWLLALAREEPRILGVVGYLPLTNVSEVERLLAAYAGTPLVGVRQLWHDHTHSDELADPAVLADLGMIGDAGLAVDVPDAFPVLWPALTHAVDRLPHTTFVLDHCGKPPFGDARAWREWELRFSELAGRPNLIVKLSGLFGGSGSTSAATDDELARVVELTRSFAGPERTMIGSDWPMSRDRLGYTAGLEKLTGLLSTWSADEQAQATSETARRIYGLP
jgi:L-fuconolactonase